MYFYSYFPQFCPYMYCHAITVTRIVHVRYKGSSANLQEQPDWGRGTEW